MEYYERILFINMDMSMVLSDEVHPMYRILSVEEIKLAKPTAKKRIHPMCMLKYRTKGRMTATTETMIERSIVEEMNSLMEMPNCHRLRNPIAMTLKQAVQIPQI